MVQANVCVFFFMFRFRLGRQEDAHEYLRCVLDAMHEAFLKPLKPKPPPELAVTTFVHRIFGGKLRSQVHNGALQQQ
jgi:ubiquitin carboxyl-terminal hydrolase 36/42